MKATYNWLKEYCDFSLEPQELAERLTMAGLEVEEARPAGDDVVYELEIAANRPDLQGVIGIAREISAITGTPLRRPEVEFPEESKAASDWVPVEVEAPDLCPRYTARIISGVQVAPSPPWLQERLQAVDLRPVNNVVDITNYVLYECGLPMHAFDYDRLRGGRIIVRRARPGEKMTLIGGGEVELRPEMLVIADAERPVALAGVMGGVDSEVSVSTRTILLEGACFDGANNRRTSQALGVASDSSYRFERGVDPAGLEWASRRGAALLRELAGGKVAAGVVDVNALDLSPRRASVRLSRVRTVLGLEVPGPRIKDLLQRLGFEIVAEKGDVLDVTVPSFRPDVVREIDVIEEIARIVGYDEIPATLRLPITIGARSQVERTRERVRELMVGLGFHEAITSSFLTREEAAGVPVWTEAAPLALRNPARAEEAWLRTSLLPGLLRVKQTNQRRGTPRAEVFEIGTVYLAGDGPDDPPVEHLCLAWLEEDGFASIRGAVERLLAGLGLSGEVVPEDCDFLTGGRSARVRLNGAPVGLAGIISAELAEHYDLHQAPGVCELNLSRLAEAADFARSYAAFSRHPASVRHLAIVVEESVTWQQVLDCVSGPGLEAMEAVEFLDLYRGPQVEAGKKSIAFSIRFRSAERTLRAEEVTEAEQKILGALEKQLGARLRT